jgi:hypothetical protein
VTCLKVVDLCDDPCCETCRRGHHFIKSRCGGMPMDDENYELIEFCDECGIVKEDG